jgi:BirA family transcriptional regulator, biotin operon repressor / biotin---[acetyl-CoA-carboxylase] ligase
LVVTPPHAPTHDDTLDPAAIARALAARGVALDCEVHARCASTNDLALAAWRAGRTDRFAIVADHQTGGRGRRGARWIAPPGDTLALTLGWPFALGADRLGGLPLTIGVAIVRALGTLGLSGLALKWPNDLLIGPAKAGGILVETITAPAGGTRAAIGVGLNVRGAVAMSAALGRPIADLSALGVALPPRAELLAAILAQCVRALEDFAIAGFAPWRERWLALHAWQGEHVAVRDALGVRLAGRAVGLAEDGALLVATPRGVQRVHSGEISLERA